MSGRRVALAVATLAAVALAIAWTHPALALDAGPFGVGRPDAPATGAPTGVFAWVAEQQSRFYRSLSAAVRETGQNPAALFGLAGISFLYGVFHAAGPGHGKAVISAYLVATGEGFRRGVLLSALAALAQAVTAIALVTLFAIVLRSTSMAMANGTWWLEAASYAAIVAVGLWLVWRKGSSFVLAAQGRPTHVHGPDCAHGHGVDPALVEGRFDWRKAGAAVLAIGLRPCTGALVVLVFAIAQGLMWAGIAATFAMAAGTAVTVALIAAFAVGAKAAALKFASARPGPGLIAIHGLEALAAVAVLALGVLLLGGLLVSGTAGGG